MTPITQLSPSLSVGGDVRPDDVAELAAAGFAALINNRPDHESPGQAASADIEAAARAHGLAYRHIPVVPGRPDPAAVNAFAAAMAELPGPVLAFCRSGARSAGLASQAGLSV